MKLEFNYGWKYKLKKTSIISDEQPKKGPI
jgi:hypothetical protein